MRTPKYRVRKDRDTAYVEMDGKRVSLPGLANSPESLDAYRRALNDYLGRHLQPKVKPLRPVWGLTVSQLVDQWLDYCKDYYGATANTRSNEYGNCRYAIRPLVALFGTASVLDFRADELKAVRTAMITGRWDIDSAKQPIKAWSRTHANAQVNKIKRLFRWGLEHGLVPADNAAILAAVAPLEKGRSVAKENAPVASVDDAVVDATLPHLPRVVADMVRLHRLTGMRSDNLCSLRPCDINRDGDVWLYTPAVHKGSHREQTLSVPLGPKCQAILAAYLNRPANAPCFCPRASSRRSTGKRAPGLRYTTGTYRNAIRRACKKHDLPIWHPHQLRHTAAKAAKRARGLEGARAYLGHALIGTTELYEERDLALAVDIARAIG